MKKAIFLLTFAFGFSHVYAQSHGHHWNYKDTNEWAACSPAYAECKLGKKQSPVDIQTKLVKKEDIGAIKTAYKPSQAGVVNNGHTIAVKFADAGYVTLPSGKYQLMQFHLHTPSEEKIDGKNFPLVAHLVHKNSENKLAVIAVLFKEGKENVALAPVFGVMPSKEGEVALVKPYDASTLLPSDLTYYAFTGSLTTPPCSENVAWQVLKTPVEVSKGQIAQFQKIFNGNARPVQPLNGRVIQESK